VPVHAAHAGDLVAYALGPQQVGDPCLLQPGLMAVAQPVRRQRGQHRQPRGQRRILRGHLPRSAAATAARGVVDDWLADGSLDAAFVGSTLAPEVTAQQNDLRLLAFVGDYFQIPTVGVAVDPTRIAPDDPAVQGLVRASRRALRTIHDQPDLAARYVNALIPSLSQTEARQLCERYVAPYFTADGRHDPSVAAQAVSSVAEELGVSTVPDTADIYRTEPAEASAGVAGSEA